MQDTKPNRAQRRAAQSNGKPKFKASMLRMTSRFLVRDLNCYETEKQLHSTETRPQIDAPSRATRFAGMT